MNKTALRTRGDIGAREIVVDEVFPHAPEVV